MYESEKLYRLSRKRGDSMRECKIRQQIFRHNQQLFDKLLKCKKRQYYNGMMIKLEKCKTGNPQEFWNYIKSLGPIKQHKIPWEVEINGERVMDRKAVMNKWRSDFKNLYQLQTGERDSSQIETSESQGGLMRQNSNEVCDLVDVKNLCNIEITEDEVTKAIMQSKTNKAVANELLKEGCNTNAEIVQFTS